MISLREGPKLFETLYHSFFWHTYNELPKEIQRLADKNYQLLKVSPFHPSLHLKDQKVLVGAYRFKIPRIGLRKGK